MRGREEGSGRQNSLAFPISKRGKKKKLFWGWKGQGGGGRLEKRDSNSSSEQPQKQRRRRPRREETIIAYLHREGGREKKVQVTVTGGQKQKPWCSNGHRWMIGTVPPKNSHQIAQLASCKEGSIAWVDVPVLSPH